jgi:diguanylate cyclase (GGDEF)-like protein
MLVDLDRFAVLTGQLGDRAGDVILQQASTRLGTCLRTGDLAARLGADRFAVLLSGPTVGHLRHVARRVVDALAEPYPIGTEQVRITASVGIAVERGDRTDPGRLLRDADEAVYAAKSRYSTRQGGAEIYA